MNKLVRILPIVFLPIVASGQQTTGFIAGLPDVSSSPVFTKPADSDASSVWVTLATGPSLEAASGLKGLEGVDLFNAVSPLLNDETISGFRTEEWDWDSTITMGGQAVNFEAASQLWVLATTSPLDSFGGEDYMALLGSPAWQAVDPSLAAKPPVIMNTSRITDNLDAGGDLREVLFVGNYSNPIELAAVPEPAHFAALFGLVGLGLVVIRRRRNR